MPVDLKDIRLFLLDMDGTVYLGGRMFPGTFAFMDRISRIHAEYLFLTNNSSSSRSLYAQKLGRLGLPTPEDRIFTSGEATALYLSRQKPGARIFLAGTPSLEEEFRQAGFQLAGPEREGPLPDFAVLGFDTTLTYQKLWRLCDLVRAGVPYIATHPDFNCPVEDGYMPDIGAMIAFVEASTGRRPLVVGKPNRPIVEAVAARTGIPLRQTAMVGDRLYTDIAMGVNSGITSILVLSGETSREDLERSDIRPDYVFEDIGALARAL